MKGVRDMARMAKVRVTYTISPENDEWLRHLSKQTGIAMSLFIDSVLTGSRVSQKAGVSDGEAMSMAFEQIAKGIRK